MKWVRAVPWYGMGWRHGTAHIKRWRGDEQLESFAMKTEMLFREIELVGGPLDGERLVLSSPVVTLSDDAGVMRRYEEAGGRTADGRVIFRYVGVGANFKA